MRDNAVQQWKRTFVITIVLIAVQEAKDVGGQEFSNGRGHAGEAVDKEVDGIATIKVKRRARPILSVSPRVDVEHPIAWSCQNVQKDKTIISQKKNTYMLMRTMPRDHTSAARGR